MSTPNYKKNVSIVSKLLLMEAAKEKGLTLNERVGVPTNVLSPVSDATRQLQQDVAIARSITGIPTPPQAQADERNPANLGQNDDEPVHYQPGPGTMVNGMRRPEDRRGSEGPLPGVPVPPQAPATATQELPPESMATRQLGQDVELARKIGGWPRFESLEGLSDKEVVEAFVESVGGVDRATFLLLADGCPLKLAETIVGGKLGQVNEAIREKLSKLFEIDIDQHAKSGNATPGFKKWYQNRMKKKMDGRPDFSPNNSANREKPNSAFSSTGKEGHDARRNK